MNCPIDGTELLITHRDNVEIDYCPKCRGVWLDRGELDKIIEYSADLQKPSRVERTRSEGPIYDDDDDFHHDRPEKRRRKSFLEDLFDL